MISIRWSAKRVRPRRGFSALIGIGLFAAGVLTPATRVAAAQQSVFEPAVSGRLNAEFRTYLRTHRVPSVVVGVWEPRKRPYLFVAGAANLSTDAARKLAQPFRIASITKVFVAVAILQLIEAGLLHKSDTMARFFPHFPNASRITIDDLLRMRSGIAAPDDDAVLAAVYDDPTARATTPEQEIAAVVPLASKFVAPDTVGVYTDLNYVILGEIVRKTTGRAISSFIAREIIQKLGLTSTSYRAQTSYRAACMVMAGMRLRGVLRTRRASIRRSRGRPER